MNDNIFSQMAFAVTIALMIGLLIWYLSRSIHRAAYRNKSISWSVHLSMLVLLFCTWVFMIAALLTFFNGVFETSFRRDTWLVLAAAGVLDIMNYNIVWKLGKKKLLKADLPSEPSQEKQSRIDN